MAVVTTAVAGVVTAVVGVVTAAAAVAAAIAAFKARDVAAQLLTVEGERDARATELHRRAQAEQVGATFRLEQMSNGKRGDPGNLDLGTVEVTNGSKLPITAVVAYVTYRSDLSPATSGAGGPLWESIGAGKTVTRPVVRGDFSRGMPDETPPPGAAWVDADLLNCSVWLTFHDANGVMWQRDFDQRLSEPG